MSRTKRVFTPPAVLPKTPRLKSALLAPPTGLPAEQNPATQQEDPSAKFKTPDFLQAYSEWHSQYPRGTVLDYVVWSYLVNVKQWQNHYEFEFKYPVMHGQATADFYIHYDRLVWQVKGAIYGVTRNDSLAQAQEALMRKEHYHVVRLSESDLLWRPEYTFQQALMGREVHGSTPPVPVGYVAN